MFCLQRKHLTLWVILNIGFLRRGVVSTSSNPQAGGPHLVGCPRLLIQFFHSYPPDWRPFLHPQPEDAPCRGDRDPHSWYFAVRTVPNSGLCSVPDCASLWSKMGVGVCFENLFNAKAGPDGWTGVLTCLHHYAFFSLFKVPAEHLQ